MATNGRIYVAGSWQQGVRLDQAVVRLRAEGHDVYDFREGHEPFSFEGGWVPKDGMADLRDPVVERTHGDNMIELAASDVVVLVLPAGGAAHMEAAWAAASGVDLVIWFSRDARPEVPYHLAAAWCTTLDELAHNVEEIVNDRRRAG